MKSFVAKIKKLWWLEVFAVFVAAHAFVGCGKSGNNGTMTSGPGLSGISNNCVAYGCFGAQAGQQIARAQGRLMHDDELDNSTNAAQSRLMEINLNINTWQSSNMNPYGSPMGVPMMGGNILATYSGPVHVSGQVQVAAPIIGCNIPQGNYQVQPQGPGTLTFGALTTLLGVNVNGGQGFTINVQGLSVMPANFVQGGISPQGFGDARLVGVVSIPNCDNATFRVE